MFFIFYIYLDFGKKIKEKNNNENKNIKILINFYTKMIDISI